ncbi:MAG TPA: RNA 2',3'-cyclic phosphodiesterase [Caulobacterales bacterium]|nr:RNA 2',3'-cyclic phosphodiesterase [Caulobacterales bacterium]
MLRLFAALALPDDVAAGLAALQRGLAGARWSPRENLHITLCFYGDVDERAAEELDSELSAIPAAPFALALKGAGFFGKAEPHALYVGVAENAHLRALSSACERAARRAGVKTEGRKYTPHVTLAYLSHAEFGEVTAFIQTHALFESRAWQADSFGLYSSHTRKSAPSLYRLEADYAL